MPHIVTNLLKVRGLSDKKSKIIRVVSGFSKHQYKYGL